MVRPLRLTAIIEREEEGYVTSRPEPDIASQGSPIEEAREIWSRRSLFFETVHPTEVERRFRSEIFVTQVEVPVG